jgi:hypothetical protein
MILLSMILPTLRRRFSDSHAPCGRRFAAEVWADREVIPPFGTKGAPEGGGADQKKDFISNKVSFIDTKLCQ